MNDSGPGVLEAAVESWRLVIGNANELARVALLPFLLFAGLHRLQMVLTPEEGMVILAWTLLFTVLSGIPAAMLLMPWYRKLLSAADPELVARKPALGWSFLLMLRWVGLELMFLAALSPFYALTIQTETANGGSPQEPSGIGLLAVPVFILGAYLFYARMGLSLPAVAAEEDHRYLRSWRSTAEPGWRICFAILLCWVSIQVPIQILHAPLETDDPSSAVELLNALLSATFSTVNELLGAAVLAQFYLARTVRPMEGEW